MRPCDASLRNLTDRRRQENNKAAPDPHLALDLNVPMMNINDLFAYGETDAESVARAMSFVGRSLEQIEDPRFLLFGNPDPRIHHFDAGPLRNLGEADYNLPAFVCELDGIADQVDQDLPDPVGITFDINIGLRQFTNRIQVLSNCLRLHHRADLLDDDLEI